jgi:di/tripeptidase
VDIIPECTNVSVGYYREHTTEEKQDIDHLINLCKACVKVDWENLSVKRDPSVH